MKKRDFLTGLDVITEASMDSFPKRLHSEKLMKSLTSIEKKCRCWVRGAGIQGFGVASRTTNSFRQNELALKVYVKEKKPRSKLKYPAPKTISLPEIGSVPIDVEEIGTMRLQGISKYRPGIPGVSCSHLNDIPGTLGCVVVREPYDGEIYFLGNSHVLALSGLAKVGDRILQPATKDSQNPSHSWIANLADFMPFKFGSGYDIDNIDAAIALPRKRSLISRELRILGVIPNGSSHILQEGQPIWKVGRTSDDTTSLIIDTNFRKAFYYPRPNKPGKKGKVGFKDLVLCQKFSEKGDSGSPVINQNNEVVGMVLAASKKRSVFIKIANIERLLKIRVPHAKETFLRQKS